MIITSVAVRNYRALEDLPIDLVGMTVLIGENSAGKSSLLQALAFFFEGGSLPPEDGCSRSPAGPVSMTVTAPPCWSTLSGAPSRSRVGASATLDSRSHGWSEIAATRATSRLL